MMAKMRVELDYTPPHPNHYESLVNGQKTALISSFVLESGRHLKFVPVAYKTWGKLNQKGDNVIVLCHALSGSCDAEDWWRPLMGRGKVFNYDKFFVFCGNQLGSPYGSMSPLTFDEETGRAFGPNFPDTTFRDDVLLQKLVLDALGVTSIAAVIGGSMGGMLTLEWPLCTTEGYIKTIIAITTSGFHSAWGISWNEAQRQAIMADGMFKDGWYEPIPAGQPVQGLGVARMVAMLTYRSAASFESRFHRKYAKTKTKTDPCLRDDTGLPTPSQSDAETDASSEGETSTFKAKTEPYSDRQSHRRSSTIPQYAAQSYMQYQADKFLKRFDANCYISMLQKMDSHDVTRGRVPLKESQNNTGPSVDEVRMALSRVPPKSLVISVETDVLFRNEHQVQLAECLPEAKFVNLDSPDGHDGFLLEFEALAALVIEHLRKCIPWAYEGDLDAHSEELVSEEVISSVFGEAEPEF